MLDLHSRYTLQMTNYDYDDDDDDDDEVMTCVARCILDANGGRAARECVHHL